MLLAKHLYLFTLCSPCAVMFFMGMKIVGRGFKFTGLIFIPASVLIFGEIFRRLRLPIDAQSKGAGSEQGGGIRARGRNIKVK